MSEDIDIAQISEEERRIIKSIQNFMGHEFNIIKLNEFLYVLPPIFYPYIPEHVVWPPDDEIFDFYDDAKSKNWLSITIKEGHIIGMSIGYHPQVDIVIHELPDSFKDLKFLNYLNIYFHSITNLSQVLPSLVNLHFLSLRNACLDYQKDIFKELKNLIGLDLSYSSREDTLIKEICKISSLKVLNLSDSGLESLPNCFQNLEKLKALSISYGNDFRSLPKNFSLLKNLEYLSCNETAIEEIAEDIKLPESIKSIDLTRNHFIDLPSSFENLPNLEEIKVDGNVVVKFIKKFNREINKAMDAFPIDFKQLIIITERKKKFLDLLLKNSIDLKSLGYYFEEFQDSEDIEENSDISGSSFKREMQNLKKKEILDDYLMQINSFYQDLKYFQQNRVTFKKLTFHESGKPKIFYLDRLNIFIGKNNSGKSYALKKIYKEIQELTSISGLTDLCQNMTSDSGVFVERKGKSDLKEIECFFIPKSRIYNKIQTSGQRKGFDQLLGGLLESLNDLKSEKDLWSFDKIVEMINFFNFRDEEKKELDPPSIPLIDLFHLIIKKWLNILREYFPDIHLNFPERTDLNTKYEFNCYDSFFPQIQYDFKDFGSGMQELFVIIFFIELLKYLPRINSDLRIESKTSHRILFIDEPELSLHPELQEAFFNYLCNASMRIQIILTTQSPFIPKPIKDYLKVIFFKKKRGEGFEIKQITNNNYILIREDLFRFQPLEIASYLTKNNYEYFRKLDYDSKEFSMGKFIEKRYDNDPNLTELLNLGTVNRNSKEEILQNAYFLSFRPDIINLNEEGEEFELVENIRIFIVQMNKIPKVERNRLIVAYNNEISDYKIKKEYSTRRFISLCQNIWDKKGLRHYILQYNDKQSIVCQKIEESLEKIKDDRIEYKTIILFSENSLPYSIIPYLLKYSNENKAIIIGGMEHLKVGNINEFMNGLDESFKKKYKAPIKYKELEANDEITDDTYINQAIIINADKYFTFQIKNIPVIFNTFKKRARTRKIPREGIPIILKPTFRKIKTAVGNLSVLICKDLMVNFPVINIWMKSFDIKILATPSFSELVNPFRNKLGEIISDRKQKDKIFLFANIAEYGGSGAYNYQNRRDFEPNRESLFLADKQIKEELFRPSIEGWAKKDFNFKVLQKEED